MKNLYLLLFIALFSGLWQPVRGQYILQEPCSTPPSGAVFETFDGVLPLGAGTFVNNVTMPGWYLNNPAIYRGGNDGSAATGGFYAYNDNGFETGLGFLASSTHLTLRAGLRLRNNLGTPIFGFLMAYRGEQWREGENGGNENRIIVDYIIKTGGAPADDVNDPGVWIPMNTLTPESMDFIAPVDNVACGTNGIPLNGNTLPNIVSVPVNLDRVMFNQAFAPGEEMMVRFSVLNQGCADHGMAIDDLIIIPVLDAPLPLIVDGPLTVCANSIANYTVADPTSNVQYIWQFFPPVPTIISPTSISTDVDFTGVPPGPYTLRLSVAPDPMNPNPGCGSTTSPLDIPINVSGTTPPPIIDSPSEEICYQPDYTVTAQPIDPPFTGTWSIVVGSPGSTMTDVANGQGFLSGIQGGFTYTLRFTVEGPGCAPTFAESQLIVLPQPVVADAGADQTTCDVPNATLTGSIPNSNGIGNWSLISGPTNPTITLGGVQNNIANITGMDFPGTYIFEYEIDYPNCDYFTDQVSVTVVPEIDADPVVETELCNETQTLLDGNNPAPGIATWTIISEPGGSSASLLQLNGTQSILQNMIPGTYVVQYTISNPPCPTNLTQVTIVNGPPLPISDAGLDQNQCETITTATVTGNTPPLGGDGQWSFVSGPATANITTVGVNGNITGMTAPGDYTFRWTLSAGSCVPETDDVIVTLVPQPTVADAGIDITECQSPNVTITGNTPSVGIGTWSVVSAPGGATNLINIPPNQALISNPIPGSYTLRWTISNAPCQDSFDDMVLTIQAPPTEANAGEDQTLCNQSAVVLNGNVPLVGTPSWSLVSGPGSPVLTPIGNVLNVSNMNIPGVYIFTYTISSGVCPASQDNITVSIDAPSNGGTLTGPTAVCGPLNPITLTLSGYVGNIIRWESSTNNFATVTSIANTNDTYVIGSLSTTTSFRVVVQNGVCPQALSTVRTVQVLPAPVPGSLKASQDIFEGCSASNFGFLSLNGFVGNIIRWESSQDNFATVTTINHTQPNYSFTNLPGPTSFRVVVGNGVCPNVISNVVTINVTLGPSLTMNDITILTGCNQRATITAFATGGQPPYSYWINPTNGSYAPFGNNGAIFNNVAPGTYTMYVRDANFCYSSITFTVANTPSPPSVRAVTNITTNRATITWTTIPPGINIRYNLRYSTNPNGPWTTVSNISTTNWTLINLLSNTTYYFQLQTNCIGGLLSGWSANNTFQTLGSRDAQVEDELSDLRELSLYPNPGNGTFTVQFISEQQSFVLLEVIDLTGKIIFRKETISEVGNNQIDVRLEDAARGVYLLRLRNEDQSTHTAKVIIE